jgi:hypothetical protein
VGHPGASGIAEGAKVIQAPSSAASGPRPSHGRCADALRPAWLSCRPMRIGEIVRTKSTTRFMAASFPFEY